MSTADEVGRIWCLECQDVHNKNFCPSQWPEHEVPSQSGNPVTPTPSPTGRASTLPTDGPSRKQYPVATGFLDYFPDAVAAVAHLSWVGNEQHNPGQPLHWAREKSTDHADTLVRHLLQRGTLDTDGIRHTAKVAWRALAMLQVEIEAEQRYLESLDDDIPF